MNLSDQYFSKIMNVNEFSFVYRVNLYVVFLENAEEKGRIYHKKRSATEVLSVVY